MTAPLAHPLVADEEVSDARLERALKTVAAVIRKRGPSAMPIFDRLYAERERRKAREDKLKEFLEE